MCLSVCQGACVCVAAIGCCRFYLATYHVALSIFPIIIKQVSACIYVHLVSKAFNLPKMCSFSNVYFISSKCVLVVNSNVATPIA